MQRQKLLKYAVLIFAVLLLDVPKTLANKKHRKQGQATTRAPPSQTPAASNQDAAKLSYGNQGPPPAYQSQPSQSGFNHQPPPPYQQNSGHPPQPYQSQPQPVIINHVQPQSGSGGLGTAGGLAVGALAGAAGGFALSKALEGDDEKKEESTSTTSAAGGSTNPSTATAESTPSTLVSTISSNETTTLNSNSTVNETTTAGNSTSIETTTLPISTPVNEALVEHMNSTVVNQALSSDGIAAKLSLNIVLLSFIYQIIF